MGFVYAALIILAFGILASIWGYDSRPVDADRPTRWLF
jgi:hypothetical protein